MRTLGTAFRAAAHALAEAGVADALVDARLLLLAAAGMDRVALIADPDRPLSDEDARRLDGWVARRVAREPVSRILGRRAFWGLDLVVTPDVLDPRPDTETVVEAVLDTLGKRRELPLRLLDLGTGSGAILCALLSEMPRASGWAVDRSGAACAVASRNLAAHGLAGRALVLRGDWAAALGGGFDVAVSNPPYIESAALSGLDPDVREHDPSVALDGGEDGLDAYRALSSDLPRLLAPDGIACFEVGRGQDASVAALMAAAALDHIGTRRDLGGIARVVVSRRSRSADAARPVS